MESPDDIAKRQFEIEFKDGSKYTVMVEVDMRDLAEQFAKRAAYNKSRKSRMVKGAVKIGALERKAPDPVPFQMPRFIPGYIAPDDIPF